MPDFMIEDNKVDYISEIKKELERLKAENKELQDYKVENELIKEQLKEIYQGIKGANQETTNIEQSYQA